MSATNGKKRIVHQRTLNGGAALTFADIGDAIGMTEDSAHAIYRKAVVNFKLELQKRGIKLEDLTDY